MLRGALRRWRSQAGDPVRGAAPATGLLDVVAANQLRTAAAWQPDTVTTPVRRPFRRAMVIRLLNPKAILFFVSFFIQFVDPAYPHLALSFLALRLIAQVTSALYLTVLIFAGTYLAARLHTRRRLVAALRTDIGALFVGFGVKLATATMG